MRFHFVDLLLVRAQFQEFRVGSRMRIQALGVEHSEFRIATRGQSNELLTQGATALTIASLC